MVQCFHITLFWNLTMELLGRTVLYPFHRCESRAQASKMTDGFLPGRASLSLSFLASPLLFLPCPQVLCLPGSLLQFPSNPLHPTPDLFHFLSLCSSCFSDSREGPSEAGISKRSFGQSFKSKPAVECGSHLSSNLSVVDLERPSALSQPNS